MSRNDGTTPRPSRAARRREGARKAMIRTKLAAKSAAGRPMPRAAAELIAGNQ